MTDIRDLSNVPISALELSARVQRCVESTRVATIGALCDLTEDELLAGRAFGETTLREVRAKLSELGLRLRLPSEPPRLPRRRPPELEAPVRNRGLDVSLAALELSVRALNDLEATGLLTVATITACTAEELLGRGVEACVVA